VLGRQHSVESDDSAVPPFIDVPRRLPEIQIRPAGFLSHPREAILSPRSYAAASLSDGWREEGSEGDGVVDDVEVGTSLLAGNSLEERDERMGDLDHLQEDAHFADMDSPDDNASSQTSPEAAQPPADVVEVSEDTDIGQIYSILNGSPPTSPTAAVQAENGELELIPNEVLSWYPLTEVGRPQNVEEPAVRDQQGEQQEASSKGKPRGAFREYRDKFEKVLHVFPDRASGDKNPAIWRKQLQCPMCRKIWQFSAGNTVRARGPMEFRPAPKKHHRSSSSSSLDTELGGWSDSVDSTQGLLDQDQRKEKKRSKKARIEDKDETVVRGIMGTYYERIPPPLRAFDIDNYTNHPYQYVERRIFVPAGAIGKVIMLERDEMGVEALIDVDPSPPISPRPVHKARRKRKIVRFTDAQPSPKDPNTPVVMAQNVELLDSLEYDIACPWRPLRTKPSALSDYNVETPEEGIAPPLPSRRPTISDQEAAQLEAYGVDDGRESERIFVQPPRDKSILADPTSIDLKLGTSFDTPPSPANNTKAEKVGDLRRVVVRFAALPGFDVLIAYSKLNLCRLSRIWTHKEQKSTNTNLHHESVVW